MGSPKYRFFNHPSLATHSPIPVLFSSGLNIGWVRLICRIKLFANLKFRHPLCEFFPPIALATFVNVKSVEGCLTPSSKFLILLKIEPFLPRFQLLMK